jgi:hypothetical protein
MRYMSVFDNIAKLHRAIYKEEQPMAITTSNINSVTDLTSAQSAAYAQNAYNQRLGQQGAAVNVYGNATTGTGYISTGIGGYTPTGIATQYFTPNAIYSNATPTTLPPMCGINTTINFTDARGFIYTITVDQSYAAILNQITIAHHSANYGNQPHPYAGPAPTAPMLEGDFSFDEMEKAEQLMKELAGEAHQGQEA